ncbi:conserved Plasmodium protein, unknown function [Plasmodium knowlesi strain H]|uniref:Protein phosphatase 2C n=3 Tax=Plasmodium knowlesi TaxID=5850 RepID=A0A5K1VR77_PLAKH|nr:uncharacterized protein PKNH_0304100 [Plasmodium knowlesi strain H]OTN68495.1 Uncharacterized protein PKNOH_S02296400 [Plasmodium knowlesi]CAA9986469.1 conserved protein, unknown function [Plasmodium knowlesi strain H]SBO24278.1 conserved Plasmodium protein, unknown function [Plasmodium knowlesi strain H]SBO29717.1 conserved Plasmodium protein, unknown function [Plasmodium knowlesi strain H]VVS75943.1 conserved protein, unknown function [Plasmodium knowlesi strain H]|eukprot:XP_002261020.1 [Plasmodium knowlesi strain H]
MKELVGRSRNERKLDGIYNKQREALLQQYRNQRERNNDIYANLNKRKANETIPFPEIYEKKRKSDKLKEVEISKNSKNKRGDNVKGEEQTKQLDNANEKNKRSNNNVTLFKGIHMIIYRYIFSKNKFVKSVNLFINLCINYLNNENKNVFFFAFDKIVEVFLRNYIHDDDGHTTTHNIYTVYSEDELHIKCMVSLFDKVINKIIDNRFQINTNTSKSDEAGNNDMQSTNMDGKMKEPLNRDGVIEATQCNDEEGIPNRAPPQGTPQSKTVDLTKQEKKYLKALKIKVYYLIILYKLNDNFIFNKLISIYRQIWEELLTEYEHFDEAVCEERRKKPAPGGENTTLSEGDDMTTSDAADSAHELADDENFLHLQDKWTLPDDYELFKIKRSAFVKCMSKVFNFIHVKWASTLVESLLLDVYFKRHIFDTCDEIVIEKLQSAAKVNMNKRKISTHSPHVLSIGESLNPVVDARAEKIVSLHGSHVWSTKQMER